jgi:hypothetical protein
LTKAFKNDIIMASIVKFYGLSKGFLTRKNLNCDLCDVIGRGFASVIPESFAPGRNGSFQNSDEGGMSGIP